MLRRMTKRRNNYTNMDKEIDLGPLGLFKFSRKDVTYKGVKTFTIEQPLC